MAAPTQIPLLEASQTQLLTRMADSADVCLMFEPEEHQQAPQQDEQMQQDGAECQDLKPAADDAAKCDNILLAHSFVLRWSSGVISKALETCKASQHYFSANSPARSHSSNDNLLEVPMPGSNKSDFLQLMPFIYPTTPLAVVTWENIEVLLTEAQKWDIPVVTAHVWKFLGDRARELSTKPNSMKYIWKWLHLADAAGEQQACTACINQLVKRNSRSCTAELLQGLSATTLQQLVLRLVSPTADDIRYCAKCSKCKKFNCPTCDKKVP